MIFRLLYTLCFYLLLPVIVLRLLLRSIKAPAYRQRWAERFGRFAAPDYKSDAIWIHAVSVGETIAAAPLIKQLLEKYPDTPLVVTTTTPTGSERVRALFGEQVFHVYAPYDTGLFVGRFLRRVRPRLVIVMETELWPNMLAACAQRQIPLLLANARLSEKSARGYAKLGGLTRAMLKAITTVAVQNALDGERFISLGLDRDQLVVTGSIKFDLELDNELIEQAAVLRQQWQAEQKRLVWIAASTHHGEDKIILEAFVRLKQQFKHLLLILVPRHPERFEDVYNLCQQQGLIVVRRSSHQLPDMQTDVVLGDTMGELLLLYGVCDIAFVGGSFVPVGGHNLIEPAAWGKAITTGPQLHNFAEIASLLKAEGGVSICTTEAALYDEMLLLCAGEQQRQSLGQAAQHVADTNKGALQKLLVEIDKQL